MKIHQFPVGQLQANCYFAVCEKSRHTAVIDPGGDADFLVQKLKELECKPKMILATHGHFDHVLGITDLKLQLNLSYLPLFIHPKDIFILKNAALSAYYWTRQGKDIPAPIVDQHLEDEQIIPLDKEKLKVIYTPGHTPGSVCFYNEKEKILFSGDLVFQNGIGRTDFSYSNNDTMKNSLQKILGLPPETVIYPGHGETTTVGEERTALMH
ncbi:MBL fold metallo-hydrolase [Patescibacteria group bacterium]|nr:MBL fold metallo-hydrolase [Patescibacteria group bacterium]